MTGIRMVTTKFTSLLFYKRVHSEEMSVDSTHK